MKNTITKQKLATLRPLINAALEAIGKEHGVSLKATNGIYTDREDGSFKLKILAINEDGTIFDKEAADWKAHAKSYGLDPELLGTKIRIGHDTFTITGLRTRSPKNCVQIKNDRTGKTHVCPPSTIHIANKRHSV